MNISNKDANKENEGSALSAASINASLHKNVIVYATDMTEEMRGSIIAIAQRAFNAPVNHHGKLYQTIADSIRSEFEKEHDAFFAGRCSSSSSGGGVNDSSSRVGAAANNLGVKSAGSGGWSCVVGDAFGFIVTEFDAVIFRWYPVLRYCYGNHKEFFSTDLR